MRYLILVLSLSGCLIPQLPGGRKVNADKAFHAAMEIYGRLPDDHTPEVFLVKNANCTKNYKFSFMDPDSGECKLGLFYWDRIWLAEPDTNLWSDTSFCHEMAHYVNYDHPLGYWPDDSFEGQLIIKCQQHIKDLLLDRIE